MLAEFLNVIPQTPSLVLITYRPDYRGVLANVPGAQTISLAPLSDSETAALLDELLGTDPSVAGIKALVAQRAGGNPFFAQEMVRELAERAVIEGDRGGFTCDTDPAEVTVPATLQATIAARIDRLDPDAKKTLNAAAVIGSRFTPELLAAVGNAPVLDALLAAALIDQVRFTPGAEFAFRHPLIRTVAYESQLKSDRAQMHRRLAAAIEAREPESADQNAALIAEHLEAAGDLRDAYGWHMRAATWATYRDIAAARLGWESATRIADALPADDPYRTTMCIAPRTMLCGIAWRVHVDNVARPLRRTAGVVQRRRGKGVAGHRDGRAGGGSRVPGPGARGVAAGFRSRRPHRVHRRSELDGRAVLHTDPRQGGKWRVV